MNVILVLVDSLNRHALEAYGPTSIRSPNFTRFAERALRFDQHFVGSLPCMPARREIFSGRKEMMWRPWGPLEPFDERLPRLLAASGMATGLVTDHYHYWEEQANGYHQAFQSTELIRGHELDTWRPLPAQGEVLPDWVEQVEKWRPGSGRRYYANVHDFSSEEDFFPAKVMTRASHWLEDRSGRGPFFLQIESFDVHEPFHVPEPYLSLYADPTERERFSLWPPYQNVSQLRAYLAQASPEEIAFVRTQYAAKVTMVDHWFGRLLDTLDQLNLWDDTAVFVTTDHGHDLGEHGQFGKQFPHHDSHAHIPLMVWHPHCPGNGRSVDALTSTVDLFATILEVAGAEVPPVPHSRSFTPLLRDPGARHREHLLYGTFGQGVVCTNGDWTLIKAPVQDGPLYSYSPQLFRSLTERHLFEEVTSGHFIPGVEMPQWRIPVRRAPRSRDNFLYCRSTDPSQQHNLWQKATTERERMLTLLRDVIAEEGAPPEQFERLGLTTRLSD